MGLRKFSRNWLTVVIITLLFASAKGDSEIESDIGDTVFIIGGVILLAISVTCFCLCRCARQRQIRKDNERIVTIHMPPAQGISTVSGQTGSYPYPTQEYVVVRPEHPLPSYSRSHPFYEEPPPSYYEVAASSNPTTINQPVVHTSNVNPS